VPEGGGFDYVTGKAEAPEEGRTGRGSRRRVYGAGGRFIRNRSGWTYTGWTVMGYCTGPTSHFH